MHEAETSPRETFALRLRSVTDADEVVLRAATREMAKEDFTFALNAQTTFAEYVTSLEHRRDPQRLPLGAVPETYLLAEVEGVIVGRLSLRHQLNDQLRQRGGHIGFGVLPAYRHHGYATEILRQALILARGIGLESVLLTCDDNNMGSRRVIESQGGVLSSGAPLTSEGTVTLHYWIALA